jgi:hypothetical protein
LRLPAATRGSAYSLALYRAWGCVGLSAIALKGVALGLIVLGLSAGGCSVWQGDGLFGKGTNKEVTGTFGEAAHEPTDSDLAFARNAVSDVLSKGAKDSSQPWENPRTGARGSVTPLAVAYSSEDGRTCRDFLASYVNGKTESWLQGAACREGHGRWEIHTLRPWQRG